jgi:hypothetical protein
LLKPSPNKNPYGKKTKKVQPFPQEEKKTKNYAWGCNIVTKLLNGKG